MKFDQSRSASWVGTMGLGIVLLACEAAPPARGPVQSWGNGLAAECFFSTGARGDLVPMSRIVSRFVAGESEGAMDVWLVLNRSFVDTTYGENGVGWRLKGGKKGTRHGHTFSDLARSDHAELLFLDATDAPRFRAKLDFFSEDAAQPSKFGSLGPSGGDGEVLEGDPSDVISYSTSMDENFNQNGYVLTESSPKTDSKYLADPEFRKWNYFVEYRISLSGRAFGPEGLGRSTIQSVHASPSKLGSNTVEVDAQACPSPGSANDPFPKCHGEVCGPAASPDKPSEGPLFVDQR
ncbi:MAG: hypothetical protein HYV07_07375 [Deltaproteobacteria bacterium]|nr:hypothetical protein [Deltaproteobacteria bacterium]